MTPSSIPSQHSLSKIRAQLLDEEPSQQPSYRNSFRVEFKYVMGLGVFEDLNPISLTLDVDGYQWSSIEAIRTILTEAGISTKQRNSSSRMLQVRELIAFEDLDPTNSISFSNVTEVPCLPVFIQSSSCLLFVTMLRLSADPIEYNEEMISSDIRSHIKDSMDTSLFLDTLKRSEAKEVLFIDSDYSLWDQTIGSDGSEPNISHDLPIAGIAIGGTLLLLAIAIFVSRSRVRDDRSEMHPKKKADSLKSIEHMLFHGKVKPSQLFKKGDVTTRSQGLDKMSKNTNSVQFDSETGDVMNCISPKEIITELERKNYEASKPISGTVFDFIMHAQQSEHRFVAEDVQTRGNYSDLYKSFDHASEDGKSIFGK